MRGERFGNLARTGIGPFGELDRPGQAPRIAIDQLALRRPANLPARDDVEKDSSNPDW
jgi:hypothetical protein